jgi:hypothetical protein
MNIESKFTLTAITALFFSAAGLVSAQSDALPARAVGGALV